MSVQIRRRGDTTAAHSNFVGAEREITIDTDKHTAVIHDGEKTGGFPLAREDLSNVPPEAIKSRGGTLDDDFVGIVFSAPLESLAGFLLCDGSVVSRAAYGRLFARIGTTFGAGDGEATFNIPDYRGMFLRGLGGNSAGNFVVSQGDAIRNITGQIYVASEWGGANGAFTMENYSLRNEGKSSYGKLFTFNAANVVPTAAENRPVNKAINFFIKY